MRGACFGRCEARSVVSFVLLQRNAANDDLGVRLPLLKLSSANAALWLSVLQVVVAVSARALVDAR